VADVGKNYTGEDEATLAKGYFTSVVSVRRFSARTR